MVLPGAAQPLSDEFYIAATSSLLLQRPRVLKHRDTFGVFDQYGDVVGHRRGAEGLYHEDTRFLSHGVLLFNRARPLLLSSSITHDNIVLAVDLTNPDIYEGGELKLPRDSVHIARSLLLEPGACLQRIELQNYLPEPVDIVLGFEFAADFADIFEVRGQARTQRGRRLEDHVGRDRVELRYVGLDELVRQCRFEFAPVPDQLNGRRADYRIALEPGARHALFIDLSCGSGPDLPAVQGNFDASMARLLATPSDSSIVRIATSHASFNRWIDQSSDDLAMLTTRTEHGRYPYAGVPWFSTAFGRDGIITALQCLWLDPGLAQGVLQFLAATQAQTNEPERDAEPGKILHETRKGEMAALGEVPFGRYYGSVDGTPLFVMLAGAYFDRTGDAVFIERLWPHLQAALQWIDEFGDPDGDGFVEYGTRTRHGLRNQGWKDSNDSVFHADGRLADPPIALCEVQCYVIAARQAAARLARALGKPDAERYATQAEALRHNFEQTFWSEMLGTYALALDGAKQRCEVRSSNAGHVLFTGVASAERAARVATTLMQSESFSEWGVRTIAASEARYNPISYHNGSVWPHENGLIGLGFARYGLREPLARIIQALFEASLNMDLHRLPELYCGLDRKPDRGPTLYPVACIPQAWSSAAVFGLLGGMLGVSFDPKAKRIQFSRPFLPDYLDDLWIENLQLGDASVDLLFRRHTQDVAMNVLSKRGELEVVLVS